ncbi:MAG: zinc ribbon-containing protein [Gammaproteobacteria bacterium]
MNNETHEHLEKLKAAYQQMLEHTQENLQKTLDKTRPQINNLVDQAVERSIELGEITKEEAEKVGAYLRRDLEDVSEYMNTTKKELGDWFRFDVELVEDQVKNWFSSITDHTRTTLDELARNAEMAEWHTGEITGPGTLSCDKCGHDLHFHNVGHIPPCANCYGTKFHRVRE